MHHARLITNVLTGVLCFVASFFIVLFPLGVWSTIYLKSATIF